MSKVRVTVLGGGNTAFSVAANLTLAGASVTLCELSQFQEMVAPIRGSKQVLLSGVAYQGVATLDRVTTDFGEALAECELALIIIPAYGHRAFAEACCSHLRQGQVVVLMPGTLGSLEFAKILRARGSAEGVILAETDTAPYVCRKLTPSSAHIWGVVDGLGLGVFPSSAGRRVKELVSPWFPGVRLYPNALACGLAALNPIVHPAGVLLNAGRVEYSRGEFYFYEEGVTPGVCRLIYAVDRERLAIAKSLDVELTPVDEAFHEAGFGPRGDLWATVNGSRMLTALRAPGSLETRWLTEDIPYGLATWAKLGEQFGVACPVMRALVELTSKIIETDFWKCARTLEDLGVAGMDKQAILEYVQ